MPSAVQDHQGIRSVIIRNSTIHFLRGEGLCLSGEEVGNFHETAGLERQLVYGALLQELGRGAEAVEQYAGLPNREARRHYNLASACWQEKRPEEALVHLLRGLTLDPIVVEALRRQEQGKEVRRGMAPGPRAGSCRVQLGSGQLESVVIAEGAGRSRMLSLAPGLGLDQATDKKCQPAQPNAGYSGLPWDPDGS